MKKIELHLDALVTIIVVFVLALSFLLYQRFQFSALLQQNIDLAWENETLKVELLLETKFLNKCKNDIKFQQDDKAGSLLLTPEE